MGGSSPRSIVPLRLAALAGICAMLAGALYALTVGTRVGQLLGELILGGRPDPAVADAASVLLASVSRTTLIIGSLGLTGWAVLQGRPRLALGVLVVIVGANLTTQLAKRVLLERTDQLDGLFYPLSNSFPSGHATAAASLAVGLLLVAPPFLRLPIAIPSSVLVALTGVATMALGWHRMADAVGASLIATSWAAAVAALLVWRRGTETVGARSGQLGRVASRVLMTAGLIMLAVGGLGYLLAALDPLGVLLVLANRGGSPALFAVGVAIVIGASFVALGALVYALRDVRLDPVRYPVETQAHQVLRLLEFKAAVDDEPVAEAIAPSPTLIRGLQWTLVGRRGRSGEWSYVLATLWSDREAMLSAVRDGDVAVYRPAFAQYLARAVVAVLDVDAAWRWCEADPLATIRLFRAADLAHRVDGAMQEPASVTALAPGSPVGGQCLVLSAGREDERILLAGWSRPGQALAGRLPPTEASTMIASANVMSRAGLGAEYDVTLDLAADSGG